MTEQELDKLSNSLEDLFNSYGFEQYICVIQDDNGSHVIQHAPINTSYELSAMMYGRFKSQHEDKIKKLIESAGK
jgi:hypothetical protein